MKPRLPDQKLHAHSLAASADPMFAHCCGEGAPPKMLKKKPSNPAASIAIAAFVNRSDTRTVATLAVALIFVFLIVGMLGVPRSDPTALTRRLALIELSLCNVEAQRGAP